MRRKQKREKRARGFAEALDGPRADARFGAGRLRAPVNNAGVVDVAARVDAMSAERVRRMFAINVFGSFSCAREALRRMSTAHGGAVGA